VNVELRPELIYSKSRLFLDYVGGRASVPGLFSLPSDGFEVAADAARVGDRPRAALADALCSYNRRLDASEATMKNVSAIERPAAVCVVGGQQAGFLGGPLYTVYKILSIVRLSSSLARRLGTPVVPVFWLATEDHDFTEINRAVFLEEDGGIHTIRFDWDGRGRPIEALPISPEILRCAREALDRFREEDGSRELFTPVDGDDYATWHARIWSRLFAEEGLVLVEPRAVRPLAAEFFREALARRREISSALSEGAASVRRAGHPPPLDPASVGGLFRLDESGRRVRVDAPSAAIAESQEHPERFSTDVALRPLLADRLFPTVANVLGPGEIAYHALLRPLYDLLETPQPVAVPRSGYTLLSEAEADVIDRLGLTVEEAASEGFDARSALQRAGSRELAEVFEDARREMESALRSLLPELVALDPGLEARWRQTVDHAAQGLDRLKSRARRADLARHGISSKLAQRLSTSLRPTGEPQERVLSFVHFAATHGVEWIRRLPGSEHPDRFMHVAVTIPGGA
jgi:bacillithiol biosynthesis cysteine-adding enzyme BshC